MKKVFIIAEAGVNHNGNIELAFELCRQAKLAGVDAVKFQTWKTEKIITQNTPKADYQTVNTGSQETQFEMLKKLELSYNQFIEIKKYCDSIDIQFLSTPDEEDSLEFLVSLGLDIIKVGSGEITNIPYLRKIGKTKKEIILSTGMSNLGEVERAYDTLVDAGAKKISLLHCTTNYPCPYNEVNLKAMQTLKSAFNTTVGYSDHTEGIEVSIAAVALGAEIIEKHFTLDKNMEGPDHKASLNPLELKLLVESIRNIELALGNGIKQANKSEIEIRKVVLKSIVASKPIKINEIFDETNLTVKRAESGVSPIYWDLFIGKKSNKNYEIDEIIIL